MPLAPEGPDTHGDHVAMRSRHLSSRATQQVVTSGLFRCPLGAASPEHMAPQDKGHPSCPGTQGLPNTGSKL